MMSRLMNPFCTFVSVIALVGMATPALAGPTPTPTTPTPATPTPATPEVECTTDWPIVTINTIGKGQSPQANRLVKHAITGHIINPAGLSATAHRIQVCAGTFVRSVITTPGGFCANNTALGSLNCGGDCHICEGTINATEVYRSVNDAGSDTDRMQIIPTR